ncbi:MAG TPA: flagellar hook-length control protein FliK, partial [Desulfosarcina sp.]|nr:flagellar hook-length control protein FliK [Desulfosarcina sp.]
VNPALGTTHAAGKAAAAETGAGTAPQPAAAGSFAQDNFHHMVERALFSVRGGQSEARIALKPDQLGHVRMQIVTENQMVSIRIVTESPAARDLIDANSQQLKMDLQQQGLNVERIEVSVGQEENDAYRGSRQRESYLRHMAARGRTPAEAGGRDTVPIPAGRTDGRGRTAGIDYFA